MSAKALSGSIFDPACAQAGEGKGGESGGQVKSLQDLPAYPREFVARRLVVFVGIVIGCACAASAGLSHGPRDTARRSHGAA